MKKDEPPVSLKINGEYVEKKLSPEKETTAAEELPIIDWNERRAAEEETAAVREVDNEKKRPGLPLKNNRKKKKHWRPRMSSEKKEPFSLYFISITAGAAVLGLLFGIMLLQFVSAGDSPAGTEPEEEPPPITADFNDSLTAYIIQAGAFTKKEKGLEMQTALTDQGYPGILTYDGEYYYLFSGMHFDKKASEKLLQYYEEEGVEVFEKTRHIPDPEEGQEPARLKENLLEVKQLLKETVKVAENEKEGRETAEKLSTFLGNTEEWEKEAYVHLKEGLEHLKEEWPEKEEASAGFQEAVMEAILYYEEAVYVYNGENRE
ncbi:hypothetical protein [Salibacterium aidingense]|uniref:hypothetical protein n=1 Tax=Salibacterium aidingense TaxID=384933 RepID=UPI003BC53B41